MRPIRSDRSWCEMALLIAFGLPQAGQLAAVTLTLPPVLPQTEEARGLGECQIASWRQSQACMKPLTMCRRWLGEARTRELSELRQRIKVAPMNWRAEEAT